MHFSEIIKFQFGKMYFTAFFNYCCLITSKKLRCYPQFSFWIPTSLAKIYFPRIVKNHTKILPYWEAPSLTQDLFSLVFTRKGPKKLFGRNQNQNHPVSMFQLVSLCKGLHLFPLCQFP